MKTWQTRPQWALSSQSRPIALSESLPPDSAGPLFPADPILLIGGVHGDEPEGVVLGQAVEKWLIQEQEAGHLNPEQPWIVIPCLNPDGVALNQRVNGRGVDLNRNYPASNWSPEHSQSRYFPGPSPGSEPEIQALVQLIQERRPKLIIHFHAWKPSIVLTSDARGLEWAQPLAQASSYPIMDSIGYPTPGSLSHFGWQDLGTPIICIEEEEWIERDKPLDQIDPSQLENHYAPRLWERWRPGFQKIFAAPKNSSNSHQKGGQ